MSYPYAVAAIIPAADRADGDKLSRALGFQPDPADGYSTFSVPLSANGGAPATHYGYNAQAAEQSFVDMLQGAASGQLPAIDWAAYGLTSQRVLELVAAMEVEITATAERPWPALLARLGLKIVQPEEPMP